MFLPIGDEPNPRGTPLVNYAIIALNVLVFVLVSFPLTSQAPDPSDPALVEYLRSMAHEMHVAPQLLIQQVSAYDVFIYKYGFRPSDPSVFNLLASMFLHAGWMHLAGNMLFLWIFGDNVEAFLGRAGYALVYLLTGAVATLFFALFRMQSSVPLVGASGAISGVLGCYFVWFPHNRVRVLTVLIWFVDVIHIPARWVLGFYVIAENLLPFLTNSSAGGVAYGAHVGGFLGGAGFAALLGRWRQRHADVQRFREAQPRAPAPTADFVRALQERSFEEALRAYSLMSLQERNALDDQDVLQLADWLTEQQRYEPALAVLQRFIATHPHSGVLPHAHLRAGLIHLKALQRPMAAYQHLLAVLDLEAPAAVEQAARAALTEIEAHRLN